MKVTTAVLLAIISSAVITTAGSPLQDGIYYDWKNAVDEYSGTTFEHPKDADSITKFMTTSRNGDVATVKRLLNNGMNIDVTDNHGLTALIYAAQEGQMKVAKLLVKRGADTGKKCFYRCAADVALCMGYRELAELLSVKKLPSKGRCITYTSDPPKIMPDLICAAQLGNTGRIKELLNKGVDINEQVWDWGTAIMSSAGNGDITTTEFLIKNGADINATSRLGGTPLIYAAKAGDMEMVKLLVNHGADVRANDGRMGYTALMFAAEISDVVMMKFLIGNGADVNAQCCDGRSALLFACMEEHCARKYLDVIRLLIKNGAYLDLQTKKGIYPYSTEGSTALIYACENGLCETAELLINSGASLDIRREDGMTALEMAKYMELQTIIELLLRRVAYPNPNSSGRTALMDLAQTNNTSKARYLILNGADVNKKDSKGMTPLMHCMPYNAKDLAKVLIEHGADVNATDNSGKTAIMYTAFSGSAYGSKEAIIRLLVDHGADVNARDAQGKTAVTLSKETNRPDNISALQAVGGRE